MDYEILVTLAKAEPGQAWKRGDVVPEDELKAGGVVDVDALVAAKLVKKLKKVVRKHGEI